MASILRTKCSLQWVTPAGATRTLPINCANKSSDRWPWSYVTTKTTGTANPVSTSDTVQADASFEIEANADRGQSVLRGFFAYVATDSITASVNLSASASPAWDIDDGDFQARENIQLIARLYSASSESLQTYINKTDRSADATITLPATVCPNVLWLEAKIQPTGDAPEEDPPINLPATTAKITFSAV
jgi:hypothetical protein